jgi:hypothetical protein
MRKFRLLSLLLLAIVFIAVNCTKEGPEGPAGATGPQGPAGNSGGAGTPGATGPAGTANVIYSSWLAASPWADTLTNGITSAIYRRTAPGVTQAIIDNGVVLVYAQLVGGNGSTQQLPYTVVSASSVQFYHLLYLGKVQILASALNGTAYPGASASTSNTFRYVIIPGGVAGGRLANGYSRSELQSMSYEQVCSLYNIPSDGSNQ